MDISEDVSFEYSFSIMFSIGKWRGRYPVRSRERRYSVRKGILINFAIFTGKHPYRSVYFLFFVFSCEFCEIYKNTFFTEHF